MVSRPLRSTACLLLLLFGMPQPMRHLISLKICNPIWLSRKICLQLKRQKSTTKRGNMEIVVVVVSCRMGMREKNGNKEFCNGIKERKNGGIKWNKIFGYFCHSY